MNTPTDPRAARTLAPIGKIVATAAILALAVSALAISSLALFTDSETIPNNSFGAGTLDLTASPATAAVSMAAMSPGDQITGVVTVGNAGSIDLRYSMTSQSSEDVLASELTMTVKSGVAVCDDANFALSGTILYTGPLGSTTSVNVLGDAAQGADAGDRILASGLTEDLCVNVSLPLAATNATQGQATNAVFTFDGEQTSNNP